MVHILAIFRLCLLSVVLLSTACTAETAETAETADDDSDNDNDNKQPRVVARTSAGEELRVGKAIESSHDLDALGRFVPSASSAVSYEAKLDCGKRGFLFHDVCLPMVTFRYWQRLEETNVVHRIVHSRFDGCEKSPSVSKTSLADGDEGISSECQALQKYTLTGESFSALMAPLALSQVILGYLRAIYSFEDSQGWQYLTSEQAEWQSLMQRGFRSHGVLFYVTSGKGFGNRNVYRLRPIRDQSFSAKNNEYRAPWHYNHFIKGQSFVLDARLGAVWIPKDS